MTQIITVSPMTAAYASQGYRTNVRASTLFEQKVLAWSEHAKANGDAQQKALMTVIHPPALVLALLTMTPQAPVSTETATRAYAENAAGPNR